MEDEADCIICCGAGLVAPCCGARVCVACLRASSEAAGDLFRCPACRDAGAFLAFAAAQGVAKGSGTPDYVAAGTVGAPERSCGAAACACARGRSYDATGARPTRRSAPAARRASAPSAARRRASRPPSAGAASPG